MIPLPNSFIYSYILVIPCIFERLDPLVFVFLGKHCCNDWSTFAICACVLITSTLLFESWNHSSIQRYCFKNLMYWFKFELEYFKELLITWLPFVVCAIHSSRNKFPFRSEDWHFFPSIRPFLIDPHGKWHSLCLFIRFDIPAPLGARAYPWILSNCPSVCASIHLSPTNKHRVYILSVTICNFCGISVVFCLNLEYYATPV